MKRARTSMFNIDIPNKVLLNWTTNSLKIVGTRKDLFAIIKDLKSFSLYENESICILGHITLKLSKIHTDAKYRKDWVEISRESLKEMVQKFTDVISGFEKNPFFFSDYNPSEKNYFDIGIEVK